MRRREFITLLGGAAAGWPLAARAQQPGRTYRLGIVVPAARDDPAIVAFLDELRVHGFVGCGSGARNRTSRHARRQGRGFSTGLERGQRARRTRTQRSFLADAVSLPPRHHRARGGITITRHLSVARNSRRGWLAGLWSALHSGLSSAGANSRQDFARYEARRSSGRTADDLRASHQPQNREGDRPRGPRRAGAARRQGDRMNRREFIMLLGGVAVAWPAVARAQQAEKRYTVGILSAGGENTALRTALFAAV